MLSLITITIGISIQILTGKGQAMLLNNEPEKLEVTECLVQIKLT